jgi:Protein of unknown function (DUF3047)
MTDIRARARRSVSVCGAIAIIALGALAVRSAPGADGECVKVENFASSKVGQFPAGWKVRKDAGKEVYSVQEEGGKRFLRAVSKALGIQAAKQHEWDPREYPILAWSWRAHQFPDGGDERESKTNDSVLAVYAVWPNNSWSAKSLKYVWSAVVPKGTHLTSSKGLTQVRVLKSGKEGQGEWVNERVNVADDYKRYFGGDEVPKVEGVAVLTDADDTKSVARGDYADFRLCRG